MLKKKVVPFTWDQLHPQNSKFSVQIEEVESGSSQLILKCMGNTVFIFLLTFLPTTEHADLRGQDCQLMLDSTDVTPTE